MRHLLGHLGPKFFTIAALTLAFSANLTPAQANIVLTWDTTVEEVFDSHPGIVGEAIEVQMHVDNGGTSVLSQTWNGSHFVKYRIVGASGWWFESSALTGGAHNEFSTDATGNVLSVAIWAGGGGAASASWKTGTFSSSGWFNTGFNSIAYINNGDSLFAADVGNNQVASSWTASTSAVPEPSSLMMFGLLGSAGLYRRRRSA